MTGQMPDPSPGASARWTGDEDIDLTHYLLIFFQWWREMIFITLAITLLATLGATLWRNLQTPTYAASSVAVIARVFSEVTLDDRFQTQSDGTSPEMINGNVWRASLVGLVHNGAIAEKVLAQVGDLLEEEERNPAFLLESISGQVALGVDNKTQSNLIRITANARDPELAAVIANAWAVEYIVHINLLFGNIPPEVITAAENELRESENAYQRAQTALEGFIGANTIASLTREIGEKEAIIESLQQSKQSAISAVTQRDRDVRVRQFRTLSDAQINSSFAVLNEQTTQRLQELSNAHRAQTYARQALDQVVLLSEQIETGGESAAAANWIALQLLKAQIYSLPSTAGATSVEPTASDATAQSGDGIQLVLPQSSSALSFSLDVGALPAADAAAQSADVTALRDALEAYIVTLDQRIDTLSEELLKAEGYAFLDRVTPDNLTATADLEAADSVQSPLHDAILNSYAKLFEVGDLAASLQTGEVGDSNGLTVSIEQLEADVQQLSSALEAESARRQRLMQQRDLAWNTFDTVSKQLIELNLERTAANSEVRLGALAIPPAEPVATLSLRLVLAAALLGGAMLAVMIALISALLGVQPFFSRRSASAA